MRVCVCVVVCVRFREKKWNEEEGRRDGKLEKRNSYATSVTPGAIYEMKTHGPETLPRHGAHIACISSSRRFINRISG